MTDWPVKTLGEVCEFVRGVTYDKKDARSEMKNGYIPLLRATNITESGLLREELVFVPESAVRADQKLMSGDALITISSGSASVVGRSVLVEDPGEMTFGAFCGVLRPGPELFPRYLTHFMSSRSVRTAWSEAAQGTNINNLKRDDILGTECPLPPLDEQKRIVAFLDEATTRISELTACYDQARTHANNLFTSALRNALESNPDWPVKTLGDICDIYQPQTIGMKDLVADGKYIVYGANGPIGRYDRFNHEHSEVTVTCRGATCGTVNVTPPEVWITGNAMVVRPSEVEMTKPMMRYVLEGLDYSSVITGAAQPQITRQNLAPSMIQVPPLEEQKRIVALLDDMKAKTSEMVAAYNAKLTAAKNLRQSILESAFAGDL